MITRRSLLGACLAGFAAPAIVRAEILMPVRKIVVPRIFPMEIGTWEGFRFIESPMLYEDTPLQPGMHGYTEDYREFQRLRNIQMRRLMDNVSIANHRTIRPDGQRWTAA